MSRSAVREGLSVCLDGAGLRQVAAKIMPPSRLAGGLGFEPRLAESESAVLPLDDPPVRYVPGYRFEYWGRLRALCSPTFLRSTSRASRVTKPARRNGARQLSS